MTNHLNIETAYLKRDISHVYQMQPEGYVNENKNKVYKLFLNI